MAHASTCVALAEKCAKTGSPECAKVVFQLVRPFIECLRSNRPPHPQKPLVCEEDSGRNQESNDAPKQTTTPWPVCPAGQSRGDKRDREAPGENCSSPLTGSRRREVGPQRGESFAVGKASRVEADNHEDTEASKEEKYSDGTLTTHFRPIARPNDPRAEEEKCHCTRYDRQEDAHYKMSQRQGKDERGEPEG